MSERIGNLFPLPPGALQRDVVYQFASLSVMGDRSLGDFQKMNAAGWTPTLYAPAIWGDFKEQRFTVTREGYIEIGGLVLMEKPKAAAQLSAEDERVKSLVLEAITKRALGDAALVNANSVRGAFMEAKEAYDDVTFRNAHRDAIVERARCLARWVGQTPDLMVSVEAPVPCRLEGMQLWFFNEARLLPVWRMFEPLAIVQVREELQDKTPKEPLHPVGWPGDDQVGSWDEGP